MVKRLLDFGYEVKGLSPDKHQKAVFTENLVGIPFHHMIFEDYQSKKHHDCIIMSESSQYIGVDKLFINAKKTLKDNGYLMICDYFTLTNGNSFWNKSGHQLDIFMKSARDANFQLKTEYDITDKVTKTLDMSRELVNKVQLACSIGLAKIKNNHPFISRFIVWLFKRKIAHLNQQIELLDADKFKLHKVYKFMLFQSQ